MSNALLTASVAQLERAIAIKEQIEALENELAQVLGQTSEAPAVRRGRPPGKRGPGRPPNQVSAPANGEAAEKPARKRRTMTPAALAALARARELRWAKARGEAPAQKPAAKVKRHYSAASRAALSAAAKKRWKKARAAGKTTL